MFNADHVGRLVITTKPYSLTIIAKCDVMYCFGICILSPPLHHNQICNVVSWDFVRTKKNYKKECNHDS
jgi:hypothetical protein